MACLLCAVGLSVIILSMPTRADNRGQNMTKEQTETIANAIAIVLQHVTPEYREAIEGILTSTASAQYQFGYTDGFSAGMDMARKLVS